MVGLPEVLTGTPLSPGVTAYRPPFEEFELRSISVAASSSLQLPANEGPQILLMQRGEGSATATTATR